MSQVAHLVCRIKPYIQPFERKLALREIQQLTGTQALQHADDENCFTINSDIDPDILLERLAYWESVKDGDLSWTKQSKREATIALSRNMMHYSELSSVLPFKNQVPIPNKRCLRYGPHDIHEYRGKFFPQLVRALLNLSGLPTGSFVLDPMCGSGTTLVEANLAGYNAIGVDLNPLSAFIATTKCEILRTTPLSIFGSYTRIQSTLQDSGFHQNSALNYFQTLPNDDQHYIESWFSPEVLSDLDKIATLLNDMPQSVCKDLFWLCLSDILRPVSYQKTEDLRIRRDPKNMEDIDTISVFLNQLSRTVRYVLAFLLGETPINLQAYQVIRGDARELANILANLQRHPDIVITSPPYATALPYLDTDRLSLVYLKLLTRHEHRKTDYQMIGNREISDSQRTNLWDVYLNQYQYLPQAIRDLIDDLDKTYRDIDVGFRRKNLPALLAKYFLDMKTVLRDINYAINDNGHVFIVVGNNHTVARGKRIEIRTAELIGSLGESIGMRLLELIPMEMLNPRDIFKKNSVTSEYIVHLQVCR